MVYFGTKQTYTASEKAHNRYCSNCDQYDTITLNIYHKYLYFFGISIIPLGKTGNACCTNCKNLLDEETTPELIKFQYNNLKNKIKKPTRQILLGIVLIITAITFSLANKKTNQKELNFLASPHIGDVYQYKVNEGSYSTMKINNVEGEFLHITLNNQKTNSINNIKSIDIPKNYSNEITAFENQKIYDMYNAGKIIQISRTNSTK